MTMISNRKRDTAIVYYNYCRYIGINILLYYLYILFVNLYIIITIHLKNLIQLIKTFFFYFSNRQNHPRKMMRLLDNLNLFKY